LATAGRYNNSSRLSPAARRQAPRELTSAHPYRHPNITDPVLVLDDVFAEPQCTPQGNTKLTLYGCPMTLSGSLLVVCLEHVDTMKRGRHAARNKNTVPPTLH
jgi:hypothetical protein